jgi:RNA recognition motif-containing protein
MSKKLYVGNLSHNTSEADLRALFAPFGTVASVNIVEDRETGRPRGFAFVEMSSGGDEAITGCNGAELGGRSLTVSEARPRKDGPRGGDRGRSGGGYGRRS